MKSYAQSQASKDASYPNLNIFRKEHFQHDFGSWWFDLSTRDRPRWRSALDTLQHIRVFELVIWKQIHFAISHKPLAPDIKWGRAGLEAWSHRTITCGLKVHLQVLELVQRKDTMGLGFPKGLRSPLSTFVIFVGPCFKVGHRIHFHGWPLPLALSISSIIGLIDVLSNLLVSGWEGIAMHQEMHFLNSLHAKILGV